MTPPQTIGHYRVVSKLGEGGMGAVYRATDTKLGRDVAIKVLPSAFADDRDRLARLTREAQVLASLNHPNIAAIYGVEERAIVLELVEGPEVKGPMTEEHVLPVVHQLIDALEYAHDRGIVHRDLKPANLKLTNDGRLKVLDFGLAKALASDVPPSSDVSNSPTITMRATMAGVIMGTAGYMSPEQARGHAVDKRADIWSFGVVVYELLTGRQLFAGETVSDTLAKVLTLDPDLSAVPLRFQRLLKLCLARDPRQRLRDISGARLLLEEAPAAVQRKASWLPWAVAAALAITSMTFAIQSFRKPSKSARAVQLSILPPEGTVFAPYSPALSRDGARIAFVTQGESDGRYQIYVRNLSERVARPLQVNDEDPVDPFWSPDGESLAYFAAGRLKKVSVHGGPAITICEAPNTRGAAWSEDGFIVFASGPTTALFKVPVTGGTPVPVTRLNAQSKENSHRWPQLVPGGPILYLARTTERASVGLYATRLDGQPAQFILPTSFSGIYASNHILFLRDQILMTQSFDAARLRLTGEPVPVAQQIAVSGNNSSALFTASNEGTLAYHSGPSEVATQFTWFDLDGQATGKVGPQAGRLNIAISPNGQLAVEDRQDPTTGAFQLWVHDLARATDYRLTLDDRWAFYPVWSPDSKLLMYASPLPDGNQLWMRPAGGGGSEIPVYRMPGLQVPSDWSRDGKFVVLGVVREGRSSIWILPLKDNAKAAEAYPFLSTAAGESGGKLSPDGKWMAYVSRQTFRREIYVTGFPGKETVYRISTNGGDTPVWSADGKHLFYVASDKSVMRVDVGSGPQFQHSAPKALFRLPILSYRDRQSAFDISPDGKRVLARVATWDGKTELHVILNWPELVKR